MPTLRQQQQLSSKQPSSSMSFSKISCCSTTIAANSITEQVPADHCALVCSLSDKLELQTSESRRISKEYEGAIAGQDAGMQTLEVCLVLLCTLTCCQLCTKPPLQSCSHKHCIIDTKVAACVGHAHKCCNQSSQCTQLSRAFQEFWTMC